MASRTLFFVAFAAVAAQCAYGWSFNTPNILGSSLGLASRDASNTIGASLNLPKDGQLGSQVELGPLGGIQSQVVLPVLPDLAKLLGDVQETVNRLTGRLTGALGNIGNLVGGLVDNGLGLFGISLPKFNLWDKIVSNFPFKFGNITDLLGQIGGVVKNAVDRNLLTLEEAGGVLSSILKDGISQARSAIAGLIDGINWLIQQKLLLEKDGIELLVGAVKDGVHKIGKGSDWAVEKYLDGAAKAGKISQEVADKLKGFVKGDAAADKATTDAAKAGADADKVKADAGNGVDAAKTGGEAAKAGGEAVNAGGEAVNAGGEAVNAGGEAAKAEGEAAGAVAAGAVAAGAEAAGALAAGAEAAGAGAGAGGAVAI